MTKKKGFTLIELLIVIAIIAILASIAYPSYQESVKRSRRVDAQSALLGLAQSLERWYTTNGSYLGAASGAANTGVPSIFSTKSPIDGSSTFYNLQIQSAAINTYIIGAEPVNAQAGDGVLILRSTGRRGWDVNNTANGTLTIPGSASEIAADEWSW